MAVEHGRRWGQWRYNASNLTVEYIDYDPQKKGAVAYYVDLERCGTAGDILDWIIQVSEKAWTRPQDIGHLVQALNELAGYGLQGKVLHTAAPVDWKARLLGSPTSGSE